MYPTGGVREKRSRNVIELAPFRKGAGLEANAPECQRFLGFCFSSSAFRVLAVFFLCFFFFSFLSRYYINQV